MPRGVPANGVRKTKKVLAAMHVSVPQLQFETDQRIAIAMMLE
jgi:hypothetical protein